MKLSKLSTGALLAALTVGGLFPAAAQAAPTQLDSTGSVTVVEGGDEEIPHVVDPEKPGQALPEVDPSSPQVPENPDLGALMIEAVTNLDFGTIKTSANTVQANAKPITLTDKTTRGPLVQWRDIRAGGTYGYSITAQLTQQFTSGTNKLTASTIDFSNGMMAAEANNTNLKPGTFAGTFQLTEVANDAKTVVTASKTLQEGKGRYVMEFGQSPEYTGTGGNKGTADKSVQLKVPANTASNMTIGAYTAKVTWKIVAAA